MKTGVGFLDHMLDLLTRHALMDLTVDAAGDLHVDAHHTVEDVGIVLGQAIDRAIGDKRGINRYGWAIIPMDESLAQVALDLGGRPAFVFQVPFKGESIGDFPTELVEEFWKSVAVNARMNLHVTVPYGTNNHHMSEAVFKAIARAPPAGGHPRPAKPDRRAEHEGFADRLRTAWGRFCRRREPAWSGTACAETRLTRSQRFCRAPSVRGSKGRRAPMPPPLFLASGDGTLGDHVDSKALAMPSAAAFSETRPSSWASYAKSRARLNAGPGAKPPAVRSSPVTSGGGA